MRVQNVRDFPQNKLDSKINAPFLLNEHGDPHFLFHNFKVEPCKFLSVQKFDRTRVNGALNGLKKCMVFNLKTFFSGTWMNKQSKKAKLCVI